MSPFLSAMWDTRKIFVYHKCTLDLPPISSSDDNDNGIATSQADITVNLGPDKEVDIQDIVDVADLDNHTTHDTRETIIAEENDKKKRVMILIVK